MGKYPTLHIENTLLVDSPNVGGTTMGPSASVDAFPPNRPAPAVVRLLLLLLMLPLLLPLLTLLLLLLLLLLRLLSFPFTAAPSTPVALFLALSAVATATSPKSHPTLASRREACCSSWSPARFLSEV